MDGRIGRGPVILAFATIYAIWGSTYLALALALQSLPPFLLVGARSVAGGLILLGDRAVARRRLTPGPVPGCQRRSAAFCCSLAVTARLPMRNNTCRRASPR